MVGEQKHEFPYLATLRGVEFGPGDYEARITVRQGRNALTRPVSFRVAGSERTAVLASAGPGAAAAATPSSADEDAEVTLPEVDPVHLTADAGAARRSRTETDLGGGHRQRFVLYSHLPNFRCSRETHRLTAPVRNADRFSADRYLHRRTDLREPQGKLSHARGQRPEIHHAARRAEGRTLARRVRLHAEVDLSSEVAAQY